MPHYCNEYKCKHNDNMTCKCSTDVFHVDRLCVTFRKKPREENFRELMQPSFKPNCKKVAANTSLQVIRC